MTKTQKNWLISLLAITLVGGATLGLVLPLTMCSVNPTPGPTPPPGPINNDLKPIGNYNQDTSSPEVYISKDQNKDDANVLRFMEIQAGSNLETTYGCSGWTVFGTKIETTNSADACFDVDINVDTIPETVLIGSDEKKIKNIGRFNSNNITSLMIPDFIEVISNDAFSNCTGLISLDLRNATSLTTIAGRAFFECFTLTGTLFIPASVTFIGDNAFQAVSFTSIEVNSLNSKYALASKESVGDAYVLIDKTIYSNLDYDYASEPIGCLACGELTVWNDPSINVLNKQFNFTGITKVIIGDNITEIVSSFTNCLNLTTLDLSKASNLAIIGRDPDSLNSSFDRSWNLTGELTIPANLTNIQLGSPDNSPFVNSAFSKLIFKGSPKINENVYTYEQLFKATINQTTEFTIVVPIGERNAYIAKFPSVPENKIIGV